MKKLFAIIGNPVAHSLSPVLHNYWFRKYKIDANYKLINLDEVNLKKTVDDLRKKKLDGMNVTLPYKQKIIPFVDKLINDAKLTNSVNTIYLDENGFVVGENTIFLISATYLKEISDAKNKSSLVWRWRSFSFNYICFTENKGKKYFNCK